MNTGPNEDKAAMAKAEASVEKLVGMIERGELHLPEMRQDAAAKLAALLHS